MGYRTRKLRTHSDADASLAQALPAPEEGEWPTAYADRVGEWYSQQKSYEHRKSYGLYLTPLLVAEFMARRITVNSPTLRILDPAAGAGILSCAAVEALSQHASRPTSIELVAYEVDRDLLAPLLAVLEYLAEWCEAFGMTVVPKVQVGDFIIAHARMLRTLGLASARRRMGGKFDIVISNPPYFKISKADPRAKAASKVVHGQPNIYALFMLVGALLLRKHGDFVFITPRSFASGPYFRQFRHVFFGLIRLTEVHVFNSRTDTFRRDEVLQENVILSGTRQNAYEQNRLSARLIISTSNGVRELGECHRREMSLTTALELGSSNRFLRLPVSERDHQALATVDSWPGSLHGFGLDISTGPVVAFRAANCVTKTGKVPETHVPLLWMSHVQAMRATWPLGQHKGEYIARPGTETILVPNRNYVLLRRFSAKEETRRLVAAPYAAAQFPSAEVGFENHLNYIHRPGGTLSEDEAWGLAALYNSDLLDAWFRAVNGSTQVSATELRAMKLPAHESIIALGKRVKNLPVPTVDLDHLVMESLSERSL